RHTMGLRFSADWNGASELRTGDDLVFGAMQSFNHRGHRGTQGKTERETRKSPQPTMAKSEICITRASIAVLVSSPLRFRRGVTLAWSVGHRELSAGLLPLPEQWTSWHRRTSPSLLSTRSQSAQSSTHRGRSAGMRWYRDEIRSR